MKQKNLKTKLEKCKKIWLINIGENLPIDDNKPMRMVSWMSFLQARGYQVEFLTTDFEHQRKIWIKNVPTNFIKLSSFISYKKNISFRRLLNHFFVMCSFVIFFRKNSEKPDVILVSYPTILLSFAAVYFGKRYKIRTIVDVRDKWPDIFVSNKYLQWILFPLNIVKKYIFRNSEIISISPEYLKWANNSSSFTDSHILPLSNSNVLSNITRVIKKNEPIILVFVGTLGSTYSLDSIYRIHDLLAEENINFQIRVCGDGPEKLLFQKQIAGRENIIFHGWLKESDLNDLFDIAHFGLMFYKPLAPQGWPNKLIEYMSKGLPIINLLKGESWELIEREKIGFNVEINEIIKAVEYIKRMSSSDMLYFETSNKCKECFTAHFDQEASQKKLLALINQ